MSTLFLTPRDRYPSDSKAPQACGSCKRQKRKCDKALPACGLCTRMERRCDYVESAQAAPAADDFAALQQRLAELEGRINDNGGVSSGGAGGVASSSGPSPGSDPSVSGPSINNDSPAYPAVEPLWEQQTASQFPPDVFLDMATYEWLNQPVPKPFIEVPAEVLQHLGDGTSVQSSIATYFTTIHPWLPIVSKKRMNMGVALSQGGPDLAMLFLAMKLMTTHPEPDSNMPAAQMPLSPQTCPTSRPAAAILLYDFYCCPATPTGRIRTPDETTQQIRAVEGIRRLSGDIADMARELLLLAASIEDGKKGDNTDIGVISPLILDALYGASNTLAWLVREEGSAECEEAVAVIKQCLVKLG
ncbi:hypothetical protein COL922a_011885, partial [Colletotrichum nupharicola]